MSDQEKKKNDVAAALAALAGGAVPSEGESPSGGIPSETTVFSPPSAQIPSQAPSRSPSLPPSRPAQAPIESPAALPAVAQPTSRSQPRTARPPAPTVERPKPAGERSRDRSAERTGDQTAPLRASQPPSVLPKNLPLPSAMPPPARIRPARTDGSPPIARPATPQLPRIPLPAAPATPPIAPQMPAPPAQQEAPETIVEMVEDEETIAAAPDASAFAPRVSAQKSAHTAIYAKLSFRRTIIPILLTCGLMLPVIGLWSMLDHNAPLAAVGTGVDVLLIVVGAVLLGLGIVNALHVNHLLKIAAKSRNN